MHTSSQSPPCTTLDRENDTYLEYACTQRDKRVVQAHHSYHDVHPMPCEATSTSAVRCRVFCERRQYYSYGNGSLGARACAETRRHQTANDEQEIGYYNYAAETTPHRLRLPYRRQSEKHLRAHPHTALTLCLKRRELSSASATEKNWPRFESSPPVTNSGATIIVVAVVSCPQVPGFILCDCVTFREQ